VSDAVDEKPSAETGGKQDLHPGPPSLIQRAPTSFSITVKSAHCPTMTRHWVHVQAGRHIQIRVTPPPGAHEVRITAITPVHAIVPLTRIEDGGVPVYYAELIGQSHRHFSILPAPGKVLICVVDGRADPWQTTIPVAIWPKKLTLVVGFLLTFFTLLWARVHSIISHNATVGEMLTTAREDLPVLAACFTISGISMAAVRLMGWIVLIPESLEGD
jgi:hypothetical protein